MMPRAPLDDATAQPTDPAALGDPHHNAPDCSRYFLPATVDTAVPQPGHRVGVNVLTSPEGEAAVCTLHLEPELATIAQSSFIRPLFLKSSQSAGSRVSGWGRA